MSEQPESLAEPARKRRRPSLGRLFDDFIVLATGQFLSKVFGFLAFAWLARVLTVEDYGMVETAVGMAAIGVVALELGTGTVGVRRIVQGERTGADMLGAVIVSRLAIAVAAAPLLAFTYASLTKSPSSDALFWLFGLSLFAIPFNHNWFFQSQEKMAIAGFGQTLRMVVFLGALVALAPQRNGVACVAYAEIIAGALMAAWYSALAFRAIRPRRPNYDVAASVSIIRESAPLGASALVNALAQYLPILFVASMATAADAAEFGAAQRLVLSLMTFSFVYYFNFYPLMARGFVDDVDALKATVAASVRVTAWAGVVLATILWALAPWVMRVVFGEDFEAAGVEFGILVWAGPLIFASGNARWLLVVGKRQASLVGAQIANAATAIVSCFVLVPLFGGTGAAAACVLSAGALWIAAHARTKGLALRPPLVPNLPAAVTAISVMVALTLLKPGLWAGAAVAAGLLAAGLALDRRLPAALKELAQAKSGV